MVILKHKINVANLVLFGIMLVVILSVVLCVRPLGNWYIRFAPVNYAYICEKYLENEQPQKVLPIVETWETKHYYDFRAHYYEAQAYAAMGDPAKAADVMGTVLVKLPAARSRNLPLSGFDEAKTYDLMARYNWDAQKYTIAAELGCIAYDSGQKDFVEKLLSKEFRKHIDELPYEGKLAVSRFAIKARKFQIATVTLDSIQTNDPYVTGRKEVLKAHVAEQTDDAKTAEDILAKCVKDLPALPGPKVALSNLYERQKQTTLSVQLMNEAEQTTAIKVIGLSQFNREAGMQITAKGLALSQNCEAHAKNITTGAYRVSNLIVNAYGTSALGVFPVLLVKIDGQLATRIYLDGVSPTVFDGYLWPDGASKKLDFEIDFINDIWDPHTRTDRNVILKNIILY